VDGLACVEGITRASGREFLLEAHDPVLCWLAGG
jgi:hypothetical protein